MSRTFCVECGRPASDDELRHGVCAECYLAKNVLAQVKDHVDVEVCVHCHARKRGEQWMEGHGSLEPVVEDAVREAVVFAKPVERPRLVVRATPEDERNFKVAIVASGVAEDVPFESGLSTRSRVKNATCIRCSRIQGGYYEAIVQVRAASRDISRDEMRAIRTLASRFIERIVTEGDRNAFVLRDIEEHGGLDIYMGTTNSGRMLSKAIAVEFGGKITEHAKTVGQKDGLDLVRMTFAVRLPEYKTGDVIVLRDEVFQVSSIGAKTVQLTEMRTGRLRHVERGEMDRARIVPSGEKREAVVVSETASELQLLDPWSFATVPVLRPEGLPAGRSSVLVLRHEGELIVLREFGTD